MEEKTKVVFIINPISGTTGKRNIARLIPEHLSASEFDYEITYTSHPGHAAEIARKAVQDRVNIVVAVGGDGTVNEVARSLVHSQTALGIIPSGSGNGLARHLNIPMHPRAALRVIAQHRVERLDYGTINGTPFFCTCGVGFDAFLSSKFASRGKRGFLSYIENTLREGLTYKPETYEIEIDGETRRYKAFLIACANASQYGNNAYIAPYACMNDGLLDVTIMEPFNVLEAPQIAIQLFNKTITQNSKIRTFQCKSLKIHRASPGVIHFDGDPKEEAADVEVKLIERDISIVVNDEESAYLSPILRTFSDIEGRMNAEFGSIRRDFKENQQKIMTINKDLLRKLKPPHS